MRRSSSYPVQLHEAESFRNDYRDPIFHFLSCTGDETNNVEDEQIPNMQFYAKYSELMTLSIGGNDIGFSDILVDCILDPVGVLPCEKKLVAGENTLYGGDLHRKYFSMMNKLQQSVSWCPDSGRTRARDCGTFLYQTAYPSFFELWTTQCDNARFWKGLHAAPPYITQEKRGKMNQLGQELNTMLAYYVANVNRQTRYSKPGHGISPPLPDFMVFADQGERYSGHRFCRQDVVEPDRDNQDTWFFNWHSNADPGNPARQSVATHTTSSGTVAAQNHSVVLGPASEYKAVDLNSCENPHDTAKAIDCMIARGVAQGKILPHEMVPSYGGNASVADANDEYKAKTFHPRAGGFRATVEELMQRLAYKPPHSSRDGCPSLQGLNLRIMAIGDEITSGEKSSNKNGFLQPLETILKEAGRVSHCTPNKYEFVGSEEPGSIPSEGYAKATVQQIRDRLESNRQLRTQRPNLIILTAGTHDILEDHDIQETADQLDSLVEFIFHEIPETTVLVQHIPPMGFERFDENMDATQKKVIKYNAALSVKMDTRHDKYNRKAAAAEDRDYAKAGKIHQQSTTWDHLPNDEVYPNDAGYGIMANAIAEKISDVSGFLQRPLLATTNPLASQASGMVASMISTMESQASPYMNPTAVSGISTSDGIIMGPTPTSTSTSLTPPPPPPPSSTAPPPPVPSDSCHTDYKVVYDNVSISGTAWDPNKLGPDGSGLKGALEECGDVTDWTYMSPADGWDFTATFHIGVFMQKCIASKLEQAGSPGDVCDGST